MQKKPNCPLIGQNGKPDGIKLRFKLELDGEFEIALFLDKVEESAEG